MRHVTRKLERRFGPGLVGLIHPVTHEFNHAAVIEMRGGLGKNYGTVKEWGIHSTMGKIHGAVSSMHKLLAPHEHERRKLQNADMIVENWETLGDKQINTYAMSSFLYGWSKGMMKKPEADMSIVS